MALHELTHNVWGPHDDNFKKLNSQLNREVASYEAAVKEGSHSLSGAVYEPDAASDESPVGTMTGGSNVLGGASSAPSTVEERRWGMG